MKYSKLLIVNLIVACVMSAFMTIFAATVGFFGNNLFNEFIEVKLTAEVEALIFFAAVGLICFLVLNLFYLPIFIIKIFFVVKNIINKKYVDTKQSIYTRDLPEYNSSIAGEIVDLKTTFQEEYIAGVIELISKGYIIENKNELLVDKTKSTVGLLKNEKYILETCENINSNLYLMNSYSFYKELKEDMYDLGLYRETTFLKGIINKILYYAKKILNIHLELYTSFLVYSQCS